VRSLGRATLVGLLLLGLAACGSDDGSSSTSSTSSTTRPATSSLDGTAWSLRDTAAFGTEGVTVTLEFADGRVSGTGGCNSYSGPYRAEGSKLTIGPDLTSTRRACAPPADAVEQRYFAALPTVKGFAVQGDTLRLTGAGGTPELEFTRADAETALLGKWRVTSLFTGDAIESVRAGATLTADFRADSVNGDAGCNTFNGGYHAGLSDITIGPLTTTMKACTDEELSTQEQQYLAALQLAKSYRIRGEQLELLREGGTIAVTLERTRG
jgi:heat shock protein HslJ